MYNMNVYSMWSCGKLGSCGRVKGSQGGRQTGVNGGYKGGMYLLLSIYDECETLTEWEVMKIDD